MHHPLGRWRPEEGIALSSAFPSRGSQGTLRPGHQSLGGCVVRQYFLTACDCLFISCIVLFGSFLLSSLYPFLAVACVSDVREPSGTRHVPSVLPPDLQPLVLQWGGSCPAPGSEASCCTDCLILVHPSLSGTAPSLVTVKEQRPGRLGLPVSPRGCGHVAVSQRGVFTPTGIVRLFQRLSLPAFSVHFPVFV